MRLEKFLGKDAISACLLAVALTLGFQAGSASASNWQEPGGADQLWTNAVNWDAGVPNAVDASAVFLSGASLPSGKVVIDSAITVGHMTVNEARFGGDMNTTFGGNGPVTFEVSSGNASVSHLEPWNRYQVLTIPAAVLNSDLDVMDAHNNLIAFQSISGTASLHIVSGSIRVERAGAGYSGDVTIRGGARLTGTDGRVFGTNTAIWLENLATWVVPNIGVSYGEDRRVLNSDIHLHEGTGILRQAAYPDSHNTDHWIFTTISGPGRLEIQKAGVGKTAWGALRLADHPTRGPTPNTYTGGTVITGTADDSSDAASDLGQVVAAKHGAFGSGDVTMSGQNWLTVARTDTIDDSATLTIAGDPSAAIDPETEDGAFLLDMRANETVAHFVVNGVAMKPGSYGKTGSGATYVGANAQLGFDLDLLFDDSFGNGGNGILTVEPPPSAGMVFTVR